MRYKFFVSSPGRRISGFLGIAALLLYSCAHQPAAPKIDQPALPQVKVTAFYYSGWLIYEEDYFKYHPVKAFDHDPQTGWLEDSAGPGIGAYIGLELSEPITFDKIIVMPGYFDTRWYYNNNRIKGLLLQAQGRLYSISFEDRMKKQQATFKKPITCQNLIFYIDKVYASGVDDDTALSEISLYYQDQEIPLDLSPVKGYLARVTAAELQERHK